MLFLHASCSVIQRKKIERLVYKLLEKFSFLNNVAESNFYSFLEVEKKDSFSVKRSVFCF